MVAALVGVVGAVVDRRYPDQQSNDQVVQWAARTHGAKVAAWVPDISPPVRARRSPNKVVTLTQLSDHAPIPLSSCPAWMATVIAGHYTYSAAVPLTAWNQWLASDRAFKLVSRGPGVVLRRVPGVVGVPNVNCPGQG